MTAPVLDAIMPLLPPAQKPQFHIALTAPVQPDTLGIKLTNSADLPHDETVGEARSGHTRPC